MKKIAIYTNHFYPEDFQINDIAKKLSENYMVTVITQIPNYPKGKYFENHNLINNREEMLNENLKVKRLFSIPRKRSKLFLFLNYISFYISSWIYSSFSREFDHVLVYITSPIFVSKAALRTARKNSVPVDMYLLDLWPDNLYSILNIKSNLLKKWFNNYCGKIYRQMDHIYIGSQSFKNHLVNMGVESTKIEYLPQHETNFKQITPSILNRELQILFAGNIGEAQGLDILIDVAKIAKARHNSDFKFNIVGDGRYKSTLQNIIKIEGVNEYFSFHPRVSKDELQKFFKENSFGLVILRDDEILNKHLPLKVQSYMAQGLPIIAIARGETESVIKESKSGVVINNYEPQRIYEELLELTQIDTKELMEMSDSAFKYASDNFTLSNIISKITLNIDGGDIDE